MRYPKFSEFLAEGDVVGSDRMEMERDRKEGHRIRDAWIKHIHNTAADFIKQGLADEYGDPEEYPRGGPAPDELWSEYEDDGPMLELSDRYYDLSLKYNFEEFARQQFDYVWDEISPHWEAPTPPPPPPKRHLRSVK